MDTIELYEACIEKEPMFKPAKPTVYWRIVGLFINEQLANDAIKLYEKAYSRKGEKFISNYQVEKRIFPQNLRHRYYNRYYKTLDEFISDDVCIDEYVEYIGADALAKLLKEKDTKNVKSKDELRIIERMLEEYSVQLKFAQKDNLMEETITKLKENVEYLERLRDEKVGFTK